MRGHTIIFLHIFDICDLDVDMQYQRITEFLLLDNLNPPVLKRKTFNMDVVNELARCLFDVEFEDCLVITDDDCAADVKPKDSALIKLMKEIISTAKHVFASIKAGGISSSDSEGNFRVCI
jgi:hypothetical protein